MLFRLLAGALGAFFLLQGLNWLADPAAAAKILGMPLLEGTGRSTQIGDLACFFLCLGGFGLYGAYRSSPHWVRAAGILVATAAVTRTIAWAIHEAPFASIFVLIELVTGGLFLLCASRLQGTTTDA